MDCSHPGHDWSDLAAAAGSCVHGILQGRILEWIAIFFSRGSSRPRDRPRSPTLQTNSLSSKPPGKVLTKMLVTQSCPTLCNPMDCSPPGFSIHGILQARKLEWVAIPFSRGSSWPMDWTHVSCIGRQILYHLSYQENPQGRNFESGHLTTGFWDQFHLQLSQEA